MSLTPQPLANWSAQDLRNAAFLRLTRGGLCEWPGCVSAATHIEEDRTGAFMGYCSSHAVGGG